MKIIHCGDLHLDSPMETHMTEAQAKSRSAELTRSFLRLTEYAAQNQVALVLIAGDMFDSARVSRKTVDMVLTAMERTPSVDYLYLSGNHDEAALLQRELPANLKRFSDRWQTYDYEQVAISGVELTQDNSSAIYADLPTVEAKPHIVMLHGQVGEAVNLKLLKNRGIAYLALGHIHSYQQAALDHHGVYCYCGCLEGRGFDECGEKGFVLINAEGGKLTSEFVPFATRQLHRLSVDITGLCTNGEMLRAMEEACKDLSSDSMVEFLLIGSTTANTHYDPTYLNKMVQDRFFFTKVKDTSRMAISAEDYRNDVSLKGEYIRTVLASDYSEEDKAALIRLGLEALTGEELSQ